MRSSVSARRVGAGGYLVLVSLSAGYALGGHHFSAYLVLLGLTVPAGPVLLLPIYFMMGAADAVSGHGLDGSPASLPVGVAGFVVAATINLAMLRGAALALAARRRQPDARVP